MLARLLYTLRHLFLPHESNNHRAKLLYPRSLAALAVMVMLANSSLPSLALVRGGILGYASDITVTQVLEQTNQQRINRDVQVLHLNGDLSEAARRKASDMFTFDYWAHVNPTNGTEPWYFFDSVGYTYRYAGENLARDFATTSPMVQAWMDSPSHRENLLSSHYVDTGIAVVNGTLGGVETTLVVQLFGSRPGVVLPKVGAASKTSALSVQEPSAAPVAASVNEQMTGVPRPLFSPLTISKSISLSALGLVVLVLLIDSVIVWRRQTHRLTGRNWAHFLFLTGLIVVIGTATGGVIQ